LKSQTRAVGKIIKGVVAWLLFEHVPQRLFVGRLVLGRLVLGGPVEPLRWHVVRSN
jgi:hypothetical protein